MKNTNDGGAAFPALNDESYYGDKSMTLLDYFAGQLIIKQNFGDLLDPRNAVKKLTLLLSIWLRRKIAELISRTKAVLKGNNETKPNLS